MAAKESMGIAGVVILYHPDEEVIVNIQSYLPYIDKLYVADNTEENMSSVASQLLAYHKVQLLYDGCNEGIAKRLNTVIDFAMQDGFTLLLTMDQDSAFAEGVFNKYLNSVFLYPDHESVGMFAVNFQPGFIPDTGEAKEVISSITSGSIVNVKSIIEVGKYNEDFFIDLVDADICYRLYNERKKVICFTYITLTHRLGYITYGRSLKSFKLTPRILHSPIRIYYIVRNTLYMLKHFSNLPPGAKTELKNTLWLLKNNLLYHSHRGKVFKYAVTGYLDYKKKRMGKLKI